MSSHRPLEYAVLDNDVPVETRVEKESGWTLDRATGAVTPWDGIRIRWRYAGERRWRKKVIVPDAELGQTVASLTADVDTIVAVLVAQYEAAE